jgi:hypothetical protein
MIDCTKTENYFNEKLRMTKKHKRKFGGYLCELHCPDCPLSSSNNGSSDMLSCSDFESFYPEKAILIVQRWSDTHPQRTYLSQFLEHYPNVQLYDTGIPKWICPYHLGLMSKDNCRKDHNCIECWNQPIPIEKDEE